MATNAQVNIGTNTPLYISSVGDANLSNKRLHAEFCKSPDPNSESRLIQLENMDRVREGALHMPESYGNSTNPEPCVVTLRGPRYGLIIFRHKRLNAASGPCLKGNVISDNIEEGPCPEQREHFSGVIDIALIVGKRFQPGFVIYFTGTVWFCSNFHFSFCLFFTICDWPTFC